MVGVKIVVLGANLSVCHAPDLQLKLDGSSFRLHSPHLSIEYVNNCDVPLMFLLV
jgi:hypothetical protein